jgi:hypothetical protein
MPDDFILFFSCTSQRVGKYSKGDDTSTILMASSGVGSMQFFPSGLRLHSPQMFQNMMLVPKVLAMYIGI